MSTFATKSNTVRLNISSKPGGKIARVLSHDTLLGSASWLLSGWAAFVFASSLPYKFSGHPTTQHIFNTIGAWVSETVSAPLGLVFSAYGAVTIGSAELISAVLLMLPAVLWLYKLMTGKKFGPSRSTLHAVGGSMAAALMGGAVFFHLFTPLGVQVLVDGVSDGGSLFRTAITVLVSGLLLVALNASSLFKK